MTPHEILGVSESATREEINLAYKRARRKHHPDAGGTPEQFHAVQKAYETLCRGPCPDCGGKGFIRVRNGIFSSMESCPICWKK